MVELTLGVNNGFAAKMWPEPMQWARLVSETLGLRHVQFSFDLLPPTLPDPVRRDLCRQVSEAVGSYGLALRTTFTGAIAYAQNHLAHPEHPLRDEARRWFEAALEVTGLLGAEATGGHIGTMSVADFENPDTRRLVRGSLVAAVRALAQRAATLGQKYFLWELMPSPREIPHTPEEAADLLMEVNEGARVPVYLAFDLGHCCAPDLERPGDPHEWLRRLLPWTALVHLQQTDGLEDRHWPFTPEHSAAGIIDPHRVVEIVRSSPMERVDLVFELGHAPAALPHKVIDDHRRSVDAWARWV